MLTFAFVQSAIDMFDVDYGYTVLLGIGGTFVVGIGALLVGVVLMFVWYLFPRSKPFFSGRASTARRPSWCPTSPATSSGRSTAGSDDRAAPEDGG
jgi:hypothetical protein